eukprot:TRINITY_DN3681_c0_g1_i1.p1 TRINITY_DN3681_c0_g1~~TRINITY_DN3681_c0_g1_i1.p1  ORF type:complete len:1115 (-),score=279.94 TRINITY_DN3681_c0_g1_i1:29-3373(-)
MRPTSQSDSRNNSKGFDDSRSTSKGFDESRTTSKAFDDSRTTSKAFDDSRTTSKAFEDSRFTSKEDGTVKELTMRLKPQQWTMVEQLGARPASRSWHDRRWGDGDVPEQIKKITGWKRAMKHFMSQDPRLNDMLACFTQKLGQCKHFTLSTLMDMVWTVLVLTWEAVISEKLPLLDKVEKDYKEKYEDLQETVKEFRQSYLEEVCEHRDRVRMETLSDPLQIALAEISGDGEDHSIYRLRPEIALDEKTQVYFKAAMVENLKIALTKGASAAAETIRQLMQQLAAAEKQIEELQASLEDALLQLKLLKDKDTTRKEPVRKESKVTVVKDDEESKRLQEQLSAVHKELQDTKAENERFRQMLELLGIDPNMSLDDLRRLLQSRENKGAKDKGEQQGPPADKRREQELARRNAELEQMVAKLEKEIAELKNRPVPDLNKATKELNDKIKDLQAELDRLKKELDAERKANGDRSKELELQKRCEELEKQLAMLKKQLNAKGDGGLQDLMKRNEELEQEVAKLNSKIELLTKEAAASKKALENAKKDLEAVKEELATTQKELEKVKADLQDALDALEKSKTKKPKDQIKVEEKVVVETVGEDTIAAMKVEIQQLNLQVAKLKTQLKEAENAKAKLVKENQELKDALEEANLMRKALEAAMEELRRKFEEFKKLLIEKGVDVSLLEEALAAAGMPPNPMSVFDRLYMDALRRHRKFQEKQYVDMRNAQQENWERILGISQSRSLSKRQIQELIDPGHADARIIYADQSLEMLQRGGSSPHRAGRSRSPARKQRSASQSRDSLDDRFTASDLVLDVVGMRPVSESQRRPFAIVSELDHWRQHHHLQQGAEPPELANPSRLRLMNASRSGSPEARLQPRTVERSGMRAEGSRETSPISQHAYSGALTRAASPSPSAGQKRMDRSQGGMMPGADSASVFEFPGVDVQVHTMPSPQVRFGQRPMPTGAGTDVLHITSPMMVDGNSVRSKSPIIAERPAMPLQRRLIVDNGENMAIAGNSVAGGPSSGGVSPGRIAKHAPPAVDLQRHNSSQLMSSRSSSKVLPQISGPSSGGLSRSHSHSALVGEKPAARPKAMTHKVTAQQHPEMAITGVAHSRSSSLARNT